MITPLGALGGWRSVRNVRTILVHNKDQPIGDSFIQAGFFHALRLRFPDARITFAVSLGKTAYASNLAKTMQPYIDEILQDQGWSLERRRCWPWTPRPLQGKRFDLVIDMEKKWWRTLALRRVRHGIFVSASTHFLFSDRMPRSLKKPPRLADQYLMLIDALDIGPRTTLPAPNFIHPEIVDIVRGQLPLGPCYIGFAPGAGDRGKCWPLENYLELARQRLKSDQVPVFLLGPMEADMVPRIREAIPEARIPAWSDTVMRPEFAHPLATVALGQALEAAVTNDSGAAHMLAAGGTRLLTLFGYTNPVKYAPLTQRLITLTPSNGGKDIASIPVGTAAAALDGLLPSCR